MLQAFSRITLTIAAFAALSSAAQEPELDKATFCTFPSMLSSMTHLAHVKGFFREAGVEAEIHNVVNGKICQDEVIAGRADFAVIATGPLAYLGATEHPVTIVAALMDAHGVSVVARKDRGITSFEDLKGKRIGYLPGTLSANFMYRLLGSRQWKRDEVKMTPLQPPAMVQALEGGQIDAFAIWDPWLANATDRLGSNAIRLSGSDYRYHGLLATDRNLLATRRATVKKVLNAYIRTERYMHTDKTDAVALLVDFLKIPGPLVEANWSDYEANVGFSSLVERYLEDQFFFIRRFENDFADAPDPQFSKSLDPSVLAEIDPKRVTIGTKVGG